MKKSLLIALLAGLSACSKPADTPGHRLFVIGVDGMDAAIARRLMNAGKLPNLKALAEEGSFRPLGTSIPPLSPVAWSNFITGRNPGGHGVFDFLHPSWSEVEVNGEKTWVVSPVDSVAGAEEVGFVLDAFGYELPMSGGEAFNKRRGTPFWNALGDEGIPATIFKIPANYPPTPSDQKTISGMGTPDLQGGYGTYFVYTDDLFTLPNHVKKGKVIQIELEDGTFRDSLLGPQNTLVAGDIKPTTTCPLRVDVDPDQPIARILVGDEDSEPAQIVLREGEWSEFVDAQFDIITAGSVPLVGVTGMVRFYLRQVRPTFQLFVDPINLSPTEPASDISTPPEWSAELAEMAGPFDTKGMPENTGALEDGVLTYDEFRVHALKGLEKRKTMLSQLVDRHKNGALFFYFSTIDLSSHMFWRCTDDNHPGHPADTNDLNRQFVESLYFNIDGVIGDLRKKLKPDDTLVVMSDHGFAPYYRQFHVNTWLYRNGYLVLKEKGDTKEESDEPVSDANPTFSLADVDWSKTRAYNLGFSSIYLNLKGRDPLGIVEASQVDGLVDEICAGLMDSIDPQNGKPVFYTMYKTRDVYSGEGMPKAPEIVTGFNREYRNSDLSTLGEFKSEPLIEDNMNAWSGCHIMAAEVVPGVIFSNRKINTDKPMLFDLSSTVLSEYGIKPLPGMVGAPLWTPPNQ